ncbi:solute symporter family protein [Actinomadura alba]|uniref:Na+:solute symporter n=1 Tax=Actinomadura alba TaxID=406431 RepID=A0ABR7LU86_9ACTN|nr:Na+:solute symporter [Actinomadura alba]MBC6468330.1 Na+:solute symporter [Actinomadura alba]
MTGVLAAPPPIDNTWAAPAIAIAVAIPLAILVFALVNAARGGIRTPNDFLLAGKRVGAGQNALAMMGAFMMYSTVIIIIGHVALNGYDAILFVTAFAVGSVLGVLIYAGPMRNVGGHTMGDLFVLRARERPARIASAVVTLVTYTMFMVAMLGAIGLVATRMFDTSPEANLPLAAVAMVVVGLVAILWVYMGGMPGVTRMLVLKAILVGSFVVVLTVVVLAKYKLNIIDLLDDAEANANPDKRGYDLLGPGRLFGENSTPNSGQDPWVHLSKLVSVVIGGMGMPWLFMRYYVATSGRDARRSAGWAAMFTAGFYQLLIIIGLGAVALLGAKGIGTNYHHRDTTLPRLVDDFGGEWASGLLGGVAMISVAAIFAAMLINAVTSYTKDINAARGRQPEPAAELKEIRRNVLVIGIVSLVAGAAMVPVFTRIFIPTVVDLGASTVLPAIVYSLFWRRFNTRGLMWTVYGGLAVTVVMVAFSNGVSGDPNSWWPNSDFKIFDIEPGLIAGPLGFLFGYLGTITSSERNDAGFAEMQVRALTGAVVPPRNDPSTGSANLPTGSVGVPNGSADKRDRGSRTPSGAH